MVPTAADDDSDEEEASTDDDEDSDDAEADEEYESYELDATALDEYSASGLPELPGLVQPKSMHTPVLDNHPFLRRMNNAASAPAAAEATYWLSLFTQRQWILNANQDMEKVRSFEEERDRVRLPFMAHIVAKDTPATREWRLRHNRAIEQTAASRHRRRQRAKQALDAVVSALATAYGATADDAIAAPTADDAITDGAADDDEEMGNAVAAQAELVYQGPRPKPRHWFGSHATADAIADAKPDAIADAPTADDTADDAIANANPGAIADATPTRTPDTDAISDDAADDDEEMGDDEHDEHDEHDDGGIAEALGGLLVSDDEAGGDSDDAPRSRRPFQPQQPQQPQPQQDAQGRRRIVPFVLEGGAQVLGATAQRGPRRLRADAGPDGAHPLPHGFLLGDAQEVRELRVRRAQLRHRRLVARQGARPHRDVQEAVR